MSLEEYKSRMPNLEEQKKQTTAMETMVALGTQQIQGQTNQGKVFQKMADSLDELAKVMGGTNGTYDDMILAGLDGTKEKYERLQRIWFKANGAEKATPAELTALVSRWYKLTRTLVSDFDGWVEFYNPNTSSLSTGTRKGSLENMECVPSTNDTAGKDDFAGNPLFAVTTCNWAMNGTEPVITAIKGISPDFEQNNPNKYVGVLQMSGYHWWTERTESNQTEIEGYCANYKATYAHIEPLPESVAMDGAVREWVLHGKYMAGTRSDGGMTCCAGVLPKTNLSHNGVHTMTAKNGATYSGGTSADRSFITLMAQLIFASKTLDGVLNGCFSYNVCENAEVSETGVKRVLLTKGKGSKYIVGSTVIIGSWDPKYIYIERDSSLAASIVAKPGCKITAIEEVTLNDVTYDAIYVDTAEPFNTIANGATIAGTTYISTMPWISGINDNLKGNNGALDITDGKHTISIQGIELMNGTYEVLADTILKLWQDTGVTSAYYYTPYIVKESSKQSTDITSDYIDTGINAKQPETDAWMYIKHKSYKNGMYFVDDTNGGSSSTYEKDALWMSAKTGGTVREFLAFGDPGNGLPLGGLSCVNGGNGVGNTWWGIGARLSPNGNRGNWQRS